MSQSSSGAVRDPGDAAHSGRTRAQHDESGRSSGSPYVPAGRDDQGRAVPSVPHEGLLSRLALSVVLGQSIVLAVVAVWGFVAGAGEGYTGDGPTRVLGLGMNGLHATVLAVATVLGAAAALTTRRLLRAWAGFQCVAFLLLFAFGSAFSADTVDRTGMNLGSLDHLLHGILALIGFVTLIISSARMVEPPPAPAPYPDGETDSHEETGSSG